MRWEYKFLQVSVEIELGEDATRVDKGALPDEGTASGGMAAMPVGQPPSGEVAPHTNQSQPQSA
ncbi:hypothetical protein KY284_005199 [Solanum tuberosum]|nr:hypothetical protein KY284_024768 [Solanum tuberosum]KAH0720169.1 hypothetical protein KY284_005199 [Solanum tuberosum]